MPPWRIEHLRGDAGAFHHGPLPDGRTATFFETDVPTLVLGSSQREASVDADAAARLGIGIVRRRSGGGGVLLLPGDYVWLDVVIPAGDELWDDDIGRSMWWVGELWCAALAGLVPDAVVHRGPMVRNRWSADVCFAGVGPGEVLRGDAKLVGVSQRRTRTAARFQTMMHRRWRADVVASLVAWGPTADELGSVAATCDAPIETIKERLVGLLSGH